MKVGTKLITKRIVYLGVMGMIMIQTNPHTGIMSHKFWCWLVLLLLGNIIFPSLILGEETFEFFNLFTIRNFKSAPISGIAVIISILIMALAILSSPYWIYKILSL